MHISGLKYRFCDGFFFDGVAFAPSLCPINENNIQTKEPFKPLFWVSGDLKTDFFVDNST